VEEEKARKEGKAELSSQEIRELIQQSVPKMANIGFCGGEIFLRKDILDLLHFATHRNRVSLVSNGTLITPEVARDLVKMGIGFMLFSVDGPPHMHDRIRGRVGTFSKVIHSLEAVLRERVDQRKHGVNVHANCVVMKENAEALRQLIDDLAAIRVRHLGLQLEDRCLHRWSTTLSQMNQLFTPPDTTMTAGMENLCEILEDAIQYGQEKGMNVYLKPDCTPQEFSDYYNGGLNLSDYECTLPWSQIFISPHGEVYPCFMMRIGNIREGKLNAVWNSEPYRQFRKTLHAKRLFPQCYGCCFMRKKSGAKLG